MVGFVFVGFALFLGDLLPWSIRALMLVGGLAALAGPLKPWARPDPGASYPYPAPDNVLDGDTDQAKDNGPVKHNARFSC